MDGPAFWILMLAVPLGVVAFDWESARSKGTGAFVPISRMSERPVLLGLALVVAGFALATCAHFQGVHLVLRIQAGLPPSPWNFWSLVVLMYLGLGLMGSGILVRLRMRRTPIA